MFSLVLIKNLVEMGERISMLCYSSPGETVPVLIIVINYIAILLGQDSNIHLCINGYI